MDSRQRFEAALGHREPDRVPIDLGGFVTSISTGASAALKAHLGIEGLETVIDRVQQLARPHAAVLEQFEVDSRYVELKPASDWVDIELDDDTYEDELGVRRKAAYRPDGHKLYYDLVGHPLGDVRTVADLARHPLPDPHDPARFEGLEEAVRRLHAETDKAIAVNYMGDVFETTWYRRGYIAFLEDLVTDPVLAEAQLDLLTEYQLAAVGELLDRVGPYVSWVMTGADLGTQRAPMIDPDVYRRLVWPRFRQLWDLVHSKTEAKVFYHSCGSIVPFIPMLIEGGVDALHPVQPGAEGMGDRAALKREFGADITFWGGMEQQRVLPFGTPDEVREEALRLLDDYMPGGGYVFAAGHNIQAEVPPENVIALFETVLEHGRY